LHQTLGIGGRDDLAVALDQRHTIIVSLDARYRTPKGIQQIYPKTPPNLAPTHTRMPTVLVRAHGKLTV
jgi:hypothetical protein